MARGRRLRGWIQACALCLTPGAAWAGPPPPDPPGKALPELDEALILTVSLDRITLSDGIPAFPLRDGYLIPLGELCRELELGLQVDQAKGTVDGFLIQEGRRFHLDWAAGTVTSGGVASAFNRAWTQWHRDDLYVDARLLSQWLPLELKVDFRRLVLAVKPRETLPLQQRWAREDKAKNPARNGKPPEFDLLTQPYALAEVPFLDQTLQVSSRAKVSGVVPFRVQSSTLAAGDLLGMSGQVYALADSTGLRRASATLGRQDRRAGLLGPLRATQFAFGEFLDPGMELVTQAKAGFGAMVANGALDRSASPNVHAFRGALPQGWQVELYRNGTLMGFQTSRADGAYEFLDVLLYFGHNEFVLVFYGPQGQRRQETVTFNTSMSQMRAGTLEYRAAAFRGDQTGRQLEVQGRYGLSGQFDASFGSARAMLDGVPHDYLQAGLDGFWRLGSASVTGAKDRLGGSVVELGGHTQIGGVDLSLRHDWLRDGFQSEVFQSGFGPILSRTRGDLALQVFSQGRAMFTFNLSGIQDRLAGGGVAETLNAGVSTALGPYFLANHLSRVRGRVAGAEILETFGDFLASRTLGTSAVRAQASYQLSGGRRLEQLSFQGDLAMFPGYLLRPTLNLDRANRKKELLLGLERLGTPVGVGAVLGYSTLNRLSLDVNVRVGLRREPRTGAVRTQSQGATAVQGGVSLQVFLDSNENGLRDPGESPVEGVAVRVNGSPHPVRTDADGILFLDGLPANQDVNLELMTSSLKDPLMRGTRPGVRVTPRPGHVERVEMPVVIHGEMTGSVFLRGPGGNAPVARMRVELVDAGGRVVRSVRTEFDGFFILSDLVPGTYRLQVSPEAAARLGYGAPAPRTVSFAPSGTALDDVDLVLEPLPPGGGKP